MSSQQSSLGSQLDHIGSQTLEKVKQADSLSSLENLRVSVLGKKGALSQILRGLATASKEERPQIGAAANQWKKRIEDSLDERVRILKKAELENKVQNEKIDVTLPARTHHLGALHPLTQTTRRLVNVFSRIGFEVTTGPEVETEYLNFDAINFPPDHPARDMQDTFFMGPGTLLRTHTSPVQMRTMLAEKPPVRILSPGAVFRSDHDSTHSPMFHQIEGLWVDRDVKMSDLKGFLEFFAKEIFGPEAKIRMRPSFFPFVEPGVEVDVYWQPKGKKAQWLEILGAGMVHPHLFKAAGYKKDEWTGFAFGMGIERIAMLLHNITDIRLFYQGDIRFLKQF